MEYAPRTPEKSAETPVDTTPEAIGSNPQPEKNTETHDQDEARRLAQERLEYELRFEQDPYKRAQVAQPTASDDTGDDTRATDAVLDPAVAAAMTSQERAAAAYERRQLVHAQQTKHRLNVLYGTAMAVIAVVLLLLIFRR